MPKSIQTENNRIIKSLGATNELTKDSHKVLGKLNKDLEGIVQTLQALVPGMKKMFDEHVVYSKSFHPNSVDDQARARSLRIRIRI
jgi:hypothetical protein